MNPVRSLARDKVASPEDFGGATSYGMNITKSIFSILAISFGIFMFVYGGYDDSPGGQGLGLIVFIVGIASIIKPNNSLDIELTLNRFGFGRISENKFQFLCFRFSKWKIPNKYSICFEINWRVKK